MRWFIKQTNDDTINVGFVNSDRESGYDLFEIEPEYMFGVKIQRFLLTHWSNKFGQYKRCFITNQGCAGLKFHIDYESLPEYLVFSSLDIAQSAALAHMLKC